MATAALEGFAMALWPIVIVIIAAVFTYNLTRGLPMAYLIEDGNLNPTTISTDKELRALISAKLK